MKNLELQKCILGPVYTNCYFLKNKETGEVIIIDPADCPEKIGLKVSQMNAKPVAILLTHGHFDHIMAAQAVKDKYIPLILGGISIAICAIYVFATCTCGTDQDVAMAIFTAITQGILIAGLSTYVNQIIKQTNKDE